jgi:hypothetical protein
MLPQLDLEATIVSFIDFPESELRFKLIELRKQHRDLDLAIATLEESGTADQLQLRRLKRQKLNLKDAIRLLENRLHPDIIA